MSIDNLPARFSVSYLGICIPPAIFIMVPTYGIFCRNCKCCLKILPSMLCMIVDIRVRADLPSHIIMPDYMICRYVILCHELSGQFNGRLHCGILKVPVFACTGHIPFIPHTHFNTYVVCVSALCMDIRFCPAMPSDIFILNRLPHGSIKINVIMCACAPIGTGIPFTGDTSDIHTCDS